MFDDSETEPIVSIEQLIASLGFKESIDMTDVRLQIIDAAAEGKTKDEIYDLMADYHESARPLIEASSSADSRVGARLLFGFDLQKALICKKIGFEEEYQAYVEYAYAYESYLEPNEWEFVKGL